MTDYYQRSLDLHKKHRGKLEVASKFPLANKDDLSLAYTPGVAEPCREIAKDPEAAYLYTMKANTVAVVTDGTAVLGLGNIGAVAGLPVMEGKCLLFKHFADVDAIPICLATQDVDEIVETVVNIAPTFGGINLEDIAAPICFEVERRLKERLDIPVFHDDQHGTAIVTLAGLLNALKVVGKTLSNARIVFSGAGAAGIAIAELLLSEGAQDIILCDSKGAIVEGRENLNSFKEDISKRTNPRKLGGSLADVIQAADVFIGVSKPGLLTSDMVKTMNDRAIIFAMANPTPEIMPDEAKAGGAEVIATGRSDFPNQINNVLAFPGVFRGVLDGRATVISKKMLGAAAHALADMVPEPHAEKIIPGPFDDGVAEAVAKAVTDAI
jgi:malate dehydrogenase (oxaloacetate-decarboxylating)